MAARLVCRMMDATAGMSRSGRTLLKCTVSVRVSRVSDVRVKVSVRVRVRF